MKRGRNSRGVHLSGGWDLGVLWVRWTSWLLLLFTLTPLTYEAQRREHLLRLRRNTMPAARRKFPVKAPQETSESELSDGAGHTDTEEKPEDPSEPKQGHSKGDKKLAKIVKRIVFGTLLLFLLGGIIAAGHLWTIGFVRARPLPRLGGGLSAASPPSDHRPLARALSGAAGAAHPGRHVPRARQRAVQPTKV